MIIASAWDKTRGIDFICGYRHNRENTNRDDRLKRLACKDVIEYILEHKAIEDLENRIEAIEQKLLNQNS